MSYAFPWFVLFLPLFAAVGIVLFTLKNRNVSATISIAAIVGGFFLTLLFLVNHGWTPGRNEVNWLWMAVGDLRIEFGLRLDPLSLLMLLVVTGVGGAIHIYSRGYMHDDPNAGRYFASLSLFTFSMLGVVLSTNFVQMFIFWELVGVSSYLLIGFWYARPSAADACKKAFLTNRLGDFGFLWGILMVWGALGSVNFVELEATLKANPVALGSLATAAGLLVFCGALGKSAQFPLHVWLPDAMEGPTPVSALIHAATMVAAGVYMLCRVFFIFNGPALEVIAWIGGFTALIAALMATRQDDIKRILAYSTLSQLGYMVMAVGLQGTVPAMYHLTTHAAFKAMLFLGAGSVIHAMHHEQNIWKMGGLRERMPITYRTFLLGTLALCGVPPFSGFFSKDEVLTQAFEHNPVLFAIATLVAMLTTFYMFRLVFVAFRGGHRADAASHAHESPGVMTWPLMFLAIPTVFAGFWGIETLLAHQFGGAAVHASGSMLDHLFSPFNHAPASAFLGLGAVGIGFLLAQRLYANAETDPLPEKLGWVSEFVRDRFYLDELYAILIRITHDALAQVSDALDRWVVSGFLVKGTHGSVELLGRGLRLLQTGSLQTYALMFAVGVAALLYFLLGGAH
jgi:NADH-quinone oxidoreductase subunit L